MRKGEFYGNYDVYFIKCLYEKYGAGGTVEGKAGDRGLRAG